MALILGIETSCDETAAAVFCTDKQQILSSCLFSQVDLHTVFGGVLPEVASRSHVEKIDVIVQAALNDAGVTLQDIDLVAVTNHPGLVGSLLVGLCFAKGLAYVLQKPLVGINHNHGHILSALLDADNKVIMDFPFPHLSISLSGGHTSIFLVNSPDNYELIGHTIDDAAGEAFDKVAKIMGLGYPGGPLIEKLAAQQNFVDFFKYPRGKNREDLNFSFSGLKTAILYHLVKLGVVDLKTVAPTELLTPELQQQVASSLLVCVRDIILKKIRMALQKYPQIKAVSMVGGVACNQFLVQALRKYCQARSVQFYAPQKRFCTDNAAMIAVVAAQKWQQQAFDDLTLDIVRQ